MDVERVEAGITEARQDLGSPQEEGELRTFVPICRMHRGKD
jgi:hypothetical protein